MIEKEQIVQIILSSIDELNEQLPSEERLVKSTDTALFGDGGTLDSLGLISLVTTIEQRIEDDLNAMVTLLQDISDIENENPFRNVQSLADYIATLLEKRADG